MAFHYSPKLVNDGLLLYLDANQNVYIFTEGNIENVFIYDLAGKLILAESNIGQDVEIRFSQYPSGMYIVNVVVDGTDAIVNVPLSVVAVTQATVTTWPTPRP